MNTIPPQANNQNKEQAVVEDIDEVLEDIDEKIYPKVKKTSPSKDNPHTEREKTILSAIDDVSLELEKLKTEKESLELSSKNINETIDSTKTNEAKLREQIAPLVTKEGRLERKKAQLNKQLEKVKIKINKVEKIRKDLSEVE